jgi:hypothetical protein
MFVQVRVRVRVHAGAELRRHASRGGNGGAGPQREPVRVSKEPAADFVAAALGRESQSATASRWLWDQLPR